MLSSATPNRSERRSRRKARVSNSRTAESEPIDEHRNSSVRRLSASVSQDDLRNFKNTVIPLLEQLKGIKSTISDNLDKVDDLTQQLTEAFQGSIDIVKAADENWEKEEEKTRKIEELTNTVRGLNGLMLDDQAKHENEVAEITDELNALRVEKEHLEQKYTDQNEARTEELQRNHKKETEELMAKTMKIQKTHDAKLKKIVDQLTKENQQNESRVSELEREVEQLKRSSKMVDRAYQEADRESKSLRAELERVQKDFWVKEEPDESFEKRFAEIQTEVSNISSTYFTELPESAIKNFDSITTSLREKSSTFRKIPINNSKISEVLRKANVQHVIMRTICTRIWTPLFCEVLDPEVQSFLCAVSSSLLTVRGPRCETAWRTMTLDAAATVTAAAAANRAITDIRKDLAKILVDAVLDDLQPLIADPPSSALLTHLQSLFTRAIELWTTAQTDGSRITVDTNPATHDRDGWTEALPSLDPAGELSLTPPPSKEAQAGEHEKPLVVFPKVIRVPQSPQQLARGLNGERPVPRVLHRGCALFADSNVFKRGAEEENRWRQEIVRALREVNMGSGGTGYAQGEFEMVKRPVEG